MRRVLLRDGLYLVPFAVYAGHGDSIDVRIELDGIYFAAEADFHDDFDIHFAGRSRVAGFGRRTGVGKARKSCGRFLFRVACCVSVTKFCEGRDSEFETVFCNEFTGHSADNLRRRLNLDDSFA